MTTFFTVSDIFDRYRGQKRIILSILGLHHDEWVHVETLEARSRAKRVACRIYELRDDWLIDMQKNPVTKRAQYRLVGKRTEPREKRAHCDVKQWNCEPFDIYEMKHLCGIHQGANADGSMRFGVLGKPAKPPEQRRVL